MLYPETFLGGFTVIREGKGWPPGMVDGDLLGVIPENDEKNVEPSSQWFRKTRTRGTHPKKEIR